MKIIIRGLVDIIYLISLTLLGKIELGSFTLSLYQVIVSIFWISGILKFMDRENEWKEELLDAVKDFIVAVSIIPIWYRITGNYENEIYEPASVIVHFLVLLAIIFITKETVKLNGKIAYLTQMMIPVIAIVLIRIGVESIGAVMIGVILPALVNYLRYIKKQKNISE